MFVERIAQRAPLALFAAAQVEQVRVAAGSALALLRHQRALQLHRRQSCRPWGSQKKDKILTSESYENLYTSWSCAGAIMAGAGAARRPAPGLGAARAEHAGRPENRAAADQQAAMPVNPSPPGLRRRTTGTR